MYIIMGFLWLVGVPMLVVAIIMVRKLRVRILCADDLLPFTPDPCSVMQSYRG